MSLIRLQCDANFIVDNDARNYMIYRTYLQLETQPRNVKLQKLSPWHKVKQFMIKLQKFMYKMGILKGHNTICCPQKFEHDPFWMVLLSHWFQDTNFFKL